MIPFLNGSIREGLQIAHEIVGSEASRLGFELIDLYEAFDAEGLESLRIHRTDHLHPNRRGHRIIAERLYDHLLGAGLVRCPRPGVSASASASASPDPTRSKKT